MRILPQQDDVPSFVEQIERAVQGVLIRYEPASLIPIEIDNWFGSKWLSFSGKSLGAIGVWGIPSLLRLTTSRFPLCSRVALSKPKISKVWLNKGESTTGT
jgi:hypothetical protein